MARKKEAALTPEERLEQALVPVEEQPYEVPGNWCWVKGTVLFNPMETQRPEGLVFRYIDIDAIDNANQSVLEPKNTLVKNAPSRASRKIHTGDTLFSLVRPYLKNIAYISKDISNCIASTGFFVCIPSITVHPQFLYRLMTSEYVVDGLNQFMKGDNSPSIRKDDIENFAYPLPPLPEQQRIVVRIESLFSKLDEAKEKAQAVLGSFETRKAAILHKAFTGELTAQWRKEHDIGMESWEITLFREFCLLKRGYDLPATQRVSGQYPLVSSSGIIDTHIEAMVKGPGVVTGRSGSIGKVFYIEENYWPLNTTLYSQNLFENNAKYVCYYLQTFNFKSYSSSTAVPTLNRNMFLDESVNVPTRQEQSEIVRILDSLLAKEQRAKEAAEAVLTQIDLIKKSILARAFRGELGTNDPAEESAVELLKTIL